jgi:hypothetical protein
MKVLVSAASRHGATTAISHGMGLQLCTVGPSALKRDPCPADGESRDGDEIRYWATELAAEFNAEPNQAVATTEE